jgi:hypothetical protein
MPPFHLAFPVRDIEGTRRFYIDVLGCREGRSAETWIDFDFRGHQISAHVRPGAESVALRNAVDGKSVPVPHFGLVLPWDEWHATADRLRAAGTDFVIEPYVRFAGLPGEQATMFFTDPSGNCIELKSFQDPTLLFAT